MKRYLNYRSCFCILGVILALSVFTLTAWGGEPESWKTLSPTIFTADPTGTGYTLMVAVDAAIRKVIPTLGVTKFVPTSVNGIVAGVSAGGSSTLGGPVNSFAVVSGIRGEAGFKQPLSHIRDIAAFQPLIFHIFVSADSPIASVVDLKGKRVTTGPAGGTPENILTYLLEANNMSPKDIRFAYLSYAESVEAFKNGQVDAVSLSGNVPYPLFVDLSRARNVKLLQLTEHEINFVNRKNGALLPHIIPSGSYRGVNVDVKTTGAPQIAIGNESLPNEFVYYAAKAIADNFNALAKSAAGFEQLRAQDLARYVGVPFHPGAEKYYREVGWLK